MTAPTVKAPAEVTAPVVPAKPLDEFGQMAKDRLLGHVNSYNALMNRIKANSSDPDAVRDALRENCDDPKVQKITARINEIDDEREKLFNRRDELIAPLVAERVASAGDSTEPLEAEAAELLKTVKSGKTWLTDLYDEAAVADLPALVGKRRATVTGGGTGQRRIRGFDVYVDGTLATAKNGKNEDVSNMAAAAKQIGVDTDVLREQFWAAAGTDDPKKYPREVEFALSIGEGDERKQVTIKAVRVTEDENRATETPAA